MPVTLTERCAADLTRAILDGKLDARTELITERKLCERLKVSRVTLRRALAELLDKRLLSRIPSKGYVLGPAALQGTAAHPAEAVGRRVLVAREIRQPIVSSEVAAQQDEPVWDGMREEAEALGLHLDFAAMTPRALAGIVQAPSQKDLRGVVLAWSDLPVAEAALAAGVPAVLMDNHLPALPLDSVNQDEESGLDQAVQHLWAYGHRTIAMIAYDEPTGKLTRRRAAFRIALLRRGQLQPCKFGLSNRLDAEGGREAARALLESETPPTALIVANQRMLPGVLAELEARNLKPGNNFSVVVWGNADSHQRVLAATSWVNATFDQIGISRQELGRVTLRVLEARIRDPLAPTMAVHVAMQFAARGSSAPASALLSTAKGVAK